MAAGISALVLGKALAALDRQIAQDAETWWLFAGQAETARELVSTIASSLLQFIAVVFSVTILVLQLASSQFSPRVLRTFLESRITQATLATFIGSFVFAISLLTEIRESNATHGEFVPALSVFVAFVLVLTCVGVFVVYIQHMAHSIRAVNVVYRVGEETRQSLERLYPDEVLEEAEPSVSLPDREPDHCFPHDRLPGVITSVNEGALVQLACDRDVVIRVVPQMGDFLPRGAPLFEVWGSGSIDLADLRERIVVAAERSPHQDAAFGFRQLVDVAERALSTGLNDPTTAVQALDQIHDLLRTLVQRDIPSPVRTDRRGQPRLVLSRPNWDSYVHLGFAEIRQYGATSIQVVRRMRAILDDLLSVAPPRRRACLDEQLRMLDAAAAEFDWSEDRRLAGSSNPRGIG